MFEKNSDTPCRISGSNCAWRCVYWVLSSSIFDNLNIASNCRNQPSGSLEENNAVGRARFAMASGSLNFSLEFLVFLEFREGSEGIKSRTLVADRVMTKKKKIWITSGSPLCGIVDPHNNIKLNGRTEETEEQLRDSVQSWNLLRTKIYNRGRKRLCCVFYKGRKCDEGDSDVSKEKTWQTGSRF